MNPLVRRYLRTAIGFLALGLGLGVWLLLAAGVVQALGMLLFFATMWTRIRASGALSERR